MFYFEVVYNFYIGNWFGEILNFGKTSSFGSLYCVRIFLLLNACGGFRSVVFADLNLL